MIGQTLSHFKITAKIGEGGMGEVYRAEDTKLGRQVAIKVLPETVAGDPESLARFEREAKVVAALNHPNIVTVHSIESVEVLGGQVHFIAMELVEGQTLSELLPKDGFSPGRLLEIAIPLADAVSCAHRAGITHRDLKPDNIMVDNEGRLRVLDFGLAKPQKPLSFGENTQAATATAVTEEGKILGTVAYMSPEQAEGKPVDPRSDVFSLGTILYEMASGRQPFHGDTNMSTIGSILKEEPVSVTEVKPALPRHLGRIVRRSLAKDPDRRYQSALDLRNELEELKAEIDSTGYVSEPHSASLRSKRFSRPLLLLGAVAALAIVALVAITSWKGSAPPPSVYVSHPITSAIGQEMDVNWSPESEFIAFGQHREGNLDVVVQPVAGGEAVVRAGGPGDETTPRWSPDGRYLAYFSSSEPGSFIYLVSPHGGSPRKLITTNIPTLDIALASTSMGDRPWAKDGKTLLISRVGESGQIAIYRVDRENGDAVQLTFPPTGSGDASASHSFDGKQIIFGRRTGVQSALMTMPAAGGDPQALLEDELDNQLPAWRSDNRHVVFLSNRGGSGRVDAWELDVRSGSLKQLTFETNSVFSVSVSADDRIAYEPFWHDTFLFTVDVLSGEGKQLTFHTQDNQGARFSPDGQSVAYHSTRTGDSEIWLHHLDGRPETRITDNSSWDLYPDWSPDGERLIFVSDREDSQFKIFIVDSDGGGARRLVDQPISLRSPEIPVNAKVVSRWSPDGEQIAFLVDGEKAQALWSVQVDGEGSRQLIEDVTGFDWYRDSRHGIYSQSHGSESEMIAIDLETGYEQSLFVGPFMEFDVAPDGTGVAFCFGPGHMAMGLAVLKLEPPSETDGLPQVIGEPEYVVPTRGTWHVHNGGWSADSRSLVYTQDKDYGDIYELVERR